MKKGNKRYNIKKLKVAFESKIYTFVLLKLYFYKFKSFKIITKNTKKNLRLMRNFALIFII